MAKKYYRLTNYAEPFIEDGFMTFRVRFSKVNDNGKTVVLDKKRCPFLKVPIGGTIGISDEYAQRMIENMYVPQNTSIDGEKNEPGYFFEQIDKPITLDNDIDSKFKNVQVPEALRR